MLSLLRISSKERQADWKSHHICDGFSHPKGSGNPCFGSSLLLKQNKFCQVVLQSRFHLNSCQMQPESICAQCSWQHICSHWYHGKAKEKLKHGKVTLAPCFIQRWQHLGSWKHGYYVEAYFKIILNGRAIKINALEKEAISYKLTMECIYLKVASLLGHFSKEECYNWFISKVQRSCSCVLH